MTKKEKLHSVILDTLKQSTSFDGDYVEFPFTLLYNIDLSRINLYKSFINHMERRYGIYNREDIKQLFTSYKLWVNERSNTEKKIYIYHT